MRSESQEAEDTLSGPAFGVFEPPFASGFEVDPDPPESAVDESEVDADSDFDESESVDLESAVESEEESADLEELAFLLERLSFL